MQHMLLFPAPALTTNVRTKATLYFFGSMSLLETHTTLLFVRKEFQNRREYARPGRPWRSLPLPSTDWSNSCPVVVQCDLPYRPPAEWQSRLDNRCRLKAEGDRQAQQEKESGSTNPAHGSDA